MNEVYLKTKDLYLDYDFSQDIISLEELIGVFQEILMEKDRLEEEFEDFKQELEDNYKKISYSEQIGYFPELH